LTDNTGFRRWYEAGFGSDLLPIAPPHAPLSNDSTIRPEHLGKTPAVLGASGLWSGFTGKWSTEFSAELADLKHWTRWGASVGLQTRNYPALDIDVNVDAVAAAVERLALDYLGIGPVRFRTGSPRRLILYRRAGGEPIRKHRLAWTDEAGRKHAVEILGIGQQCVVEGPYSKGGIYEWREGEGPCECGQDNLTEITLERVDQFFSALAALIERKGGTIVRGTVSSSTPSTRKDGDDASLHAKSPELVLAALECIPVDFDTFPDRDSFVRFLAAVWAALGPQRQDYWADVLEWALQFPGSEEPFIAKIWDSFTDSALGADWLFGFARGFGFTADAQDDFDDGFDPETQMEKTPFDRMLDRYVWVEDLGCYNDTVRGGFLGSREFNAANVHVMPFGGSGRQTAEAFFQNSPKARKVDTATSRPGEPIITSAENERGISVKAVNLWRPSAIKPRRDVAAADIGLWLELVTALFGPEGVPEREHFLDWQAFVLQNPGKKIGHALVIVGGQGVGKDSVLTPFFEAIGQHNVAAIDTAAIAGQWTYFLKCQVVYVQEVITYGRRDLYNYVKPFISGQRTRLTVNEKGLRQFFVANHQNWIMSSNHDNALSLEDDDRRFWVHRVLADEPPRDEFFDRLYAWFDRGGIEAVSGWLLQRDVSGFNPMARPPMTAAKREMLDQSQPAPVRWFRGRFVDGEALHGRTIMTTNDLVRLAETDWGAPEGFTDKQAMAALKAEGFRPACRVRLPEGMRQLWVNDPQGSLRQLTAAQLRERYASEIAGAW
jgi:Family of unknown function (DUF5906)